MMEQDGVLDASAKARARRLREEGASLDEALARAAASQKAALRYLAGAFGLPYVEPESAAPDAELLRQFPARLLLKRGLLPLREEDGTVLVATSRVFDTSGLDELRLATGRELRPALATEEEIARCAKRLLGVGADTVQTLVSEGGVRLTGDAEGAVDLGEDTEDATIIRFVNQVLSEAIDLRATDVHFEPFEEQLRVRYRIDGVLQEAAIPPAARHFQASIVSRLKILSGLDIAEKRAPQDGRIKLTVTGREIDVRVSVIPMLHGEAVVLRLLDRSAALRGLDALGMSPETCLALERICEIPHGIVLVTGPTGSGKTTTLYAALSRINDVRRKIITIEDPIEYHLYGINQIQVAPKAGMTFSLGLRSILRHDPDVILVGEIRDQQTAQIAVQASLTGHLVFSTLHTNDAPGAVTRLVDMGVEPYLVASSLEAVLAQRLVRVICPDCAEPYEPSEPEALKATFHCEAPELLHRGAGCRRCQGTGYYGRTGVFELMAITEQVRSLILRRASTGQIRAAALAEGMCSLRQDGWRHVLAGKSTVEEVLRVTKDEQLRAASAPQRTEGEP